MPAPLVSVLIVTWNRRDDVLVTLQSVYQQSYRPLQVILVDNGSGDGTVAAVQSQFPDVEIVSLEQNLGICIGRNRGIVRAHGEFIFLLDSDASLVDDTLAIVVDRLRSNPALGAITTKVLNSTTLEIDRNAWLFTERDLEHQGLTFPSYSFSEGATAIRREIFERCGMFCELLFWGREGEELALRIWATDYYHILYDPKAVVLHRVSPQARFVTGRYLYYDLRNALLIQLLHYPFRYLVWLAPIRIATALFRGIRCRSLRFVLAALVNVAWHAPGLLIRRRPMNEDAARGYFRLLHEHGPLRWTLVQWVRHKGLRATR